MPYGTNEEQLSIISAILLWKYVCFIAYFLYKPLIYKKKP